MWLSLYHSHPMLSLPFPSLQCPLPHLLYPKWSFIKVHHCHIKIQDVTDQTYAFLKKISSSSYFTLNANSHDTHQAGTRVHYSPGTRLCFQSAFPPTETTLSSNMERNSSVQTVTSSSIRKALLSSQRSTCSWTHSRTLGILREQLLF